MLTHLFHAGFTWVYNIMSQRTVSTTQIMARLRAETWPLHQQLEALPFSQALVAETLPLALYVGQLTAYLPIHRALENHCQHTLHPQVLAVWQPEMARLPDLNADLSHFIVDIPKAPVQRATADCVQAIEHASEMPVMLLGILYVLEGSTLGAQFLLPHLQAAYELDQQGVQYYRGRGAHTRAHWQQFSQRMNDNIIQIADQNLVVDGAKMAFLHLQHLFSALWKSY